MQVYRRMHSYPVGTQIEMPSGYVKVKIARNKWEGLGAHLLKEAGEEIEEGHRVFFKDGNRLNRDVNNLTAIFFRSIRFMPVIKRSRPIHIPNVEQVKEEEVA